MYIVFFASLEYLFLPSTPPNIEVETTFTLTSLGTIIVIPPNIAVQLIMFSFFVLAFLKSHLIPPNILDNSHPLKSSS